MDTIVKEAIKAIGDPFLIVLLAIIWMQFKMLMKRDEILLNITNEVHKNGKMLASMASLMEVLVYGRGKTHEIDS